MRNFLNDIVAQIWTVLGMFVAWIVLEGSAKSVVGWCILVVLAVWIVTFRLRNPKE
jgi:hypothetical protein